MKTYFLIGSTAIACVIAAGFGLARWNTYLAWQDYNKGREMISEEENTDEGLDLLAKAGLTLSRDKKFIEGYGSILEGLGRHDAAIALYEEALEAVYIPSLLERISALYLEKGEFQRAIEYSEKALNILPWKLSPRFRLASAHLGSGDREKAFTYALDTIITPMKVYSARGLELKQKAREMLTVSVADEMPPGKDVRSILSGIEDPGCSLRLRTALLAAGENRGELEKTLLESPPEHLEALIFLLVNMPEADLRNLDSAYLLNNTELAFQVRNIWPFMPDIPDDIFMNYLLPYAQAGEARDNWRGDFMDRYLPVMKESKSVGEVVIGLNAWMPNELNIQFDHDNVSDSFWSVGTTIEKRLANCISLSILLADACRAVGIPARVTTIPRWKDIPGGHTWVEVYDQGTWRHTGAFEPSPLDRTWFEERTSATDDSKFMHRIYAASFRRTDIQILRYGPDTWWTDVTGNYVK